MPGGRPLLEKVMEDGNAVRPSEPLAELRERCKRAISSLPRELLSLEGTQDPYPVRLSDRLQGLVDEMHGSSR
ncbi:MAG: hypothetical protein M3526_00445 [Actinomycetota bacterium]|nr:hypothetical protein [Actinomycetota bacterium]